MWIYAALTPVSFLLITGFEYLFLPSRYERIKKDIRLNFTALCIASAITGAGLWLFERLSSCT